MPGRQGAQTDGGRLAKEKQSKQCDIDGKQKQSRENASKEQNQDKDRNDKSASKESGTKDAQGQEILRNGRAVGIRVLAPAATASASSPSGSTSQTPYIFRISNRLNSEPPEDEAAPQTSASSGEPTAAPHRPPRRPSAHSRADYNRVDIRYTNFIAPANKVRHNGCDESWDQHLTYALLVEQKYMNIHPL